jgi:hypothetical protein
MKRTVALLVGLSALLSAATTLASSDLAFAYHWEDRRYVWRYNPEGEPPWLESAAALDLVQQAARSWESCGIHMEYAGLTALSPGVKDGSNVVGWKKDGKDYSAWTYWVARKDGQAIEADIILYRNIFDRYREQGMDALLELRKSLIHEFGHALGMSHSPQAADAMSVRFRTRAGWQLPSDNDLARCRAIYPPPPAAAPVAGSQGTSE